MEDSLILKTIFVSLIHFFYKNQTILAEPQSSYCFSKFWAHLSYFVLVIIIIFDLALHICIFIIHAGYFWLVMAGLKEKFYNLILRFVYITFFLLMEPQTILQEDFDGTDLILL